MYRQLNIDPPSLVSNFYQKFMSQVIGQPHLAHTLAELFGAISAKACNPTKPSGMVFIAGQTGVGKSLAARTWSKLTLGYEEALVKVDCEALIADHTSAQIVGAPPGYVGHKDTIPLLSQVNIELKRDPRFPIVPISFEEIEKAPITLYNILLGLEVGQITLADNSVTDLRDTVIFFTSNIGGRELQRALTGRIGFNQRRSDYEPGDQEELKEIVLKAAKKHFPPEFLNRLDEFIVCMPLTREDTERVLDLEIKRYQKLLYVQDPKSSPIFTCGPHLKAKMLDKGYSEEYGARQMRRTVERFLKPVITGLKLNGGFHIQAEHILIDILPGRQEIFAAVDESISAHKNLALRDQLAKECLNLEFSMERGNLDRHQSRRELVDRIHKRLRRK